ncbi:MAG: glycosyltransferase family A protein, partial [Planctomycetota bacterium]
MPRVSVVMAVHNAADYLPQALASLRWQTITDWECVAVDDGSTDGSADVLHRFAERDARFRVMSQAKAGITAALTLGDAAARCDTIARMDSDDVALPTRLERQLGHLESHPECVGVGAQVMLIDPTGAPIGVAPHATEHAEIERRLLAAEGGTIAHPTL